MWLPSQGFLYEVLSEDELVVFQVIQTPGLWESDRSGFALGTANQDAGTCGC